MDGQTIALIKETLTDDMENTVLTGLVRYGMIPRVITESEEAAFRLCHHDFFGLTQQQAAEVLGITRQGIGDKLKSVRRKAPQLFPILSKNVAIIYDRFTTDNMSVREIADDLSLTPRYCWQVLKDLWDCRKETGLYFRLGTAARLHYRPWMDEHVKGVF